MYSLMLLNLCGDRLLMMLSEKPQYQNDQVEVSDPYQDSSSGPCRMWRERESLINTKLGRKKGGD